jgi:hypothetical protein
MANECIKLELVRTADGYQRMKELTIMKQKCIQLKDFILNAELPLCTTVTEWFV